jgi:hypothetical protein
MHVQVHLISPQKFDEFLSVTYIPHGAWHSWHLLLHPNDYFAHLPQNIALPHHIALALTTLTEQECILTPRWPERVSYSLTKFPPTREEMGLQANIYTRKCA